MIEAIQHILDNPVASLLVIGNLILIESILSVDNAAVLATMVMDLPAHQRAHALRYGIIGAYLFRGLCLLFASILVQIWWLKPLGGLYLLYLVAKWVHGKQTPRTDDDLLDKKNHRLYQMTVGKLGVFWSTVLLIEIMDLAFSIDNVFAAVAFTDNLLLIYLGVFIGILAMRFVAQGFVGLMERFPFLESAAFVVIGLLGLKLLLSSINHFYPDSTLVTIMESHETDAIVSLITVLIFVVPLITSSLFNFPARQRS